MWIYGQLVRQSFGNTRLDLVFAPFNHLAVLVVEGAAAAVDVFLVVSVVVGGEEGTVRTEKHFFFEESLSWFCLFETLQITWLSPSEWNFDESRKYGVQ